MRAMERVAIFAAALLGLVITACDRSTDAKTTADTPTKTAGADRTTQAQSSNVPSDLSPSTAPTQPANQPTETDRGLEVDASFVFHGIGKNGSDLFAFIGNIPARQVMEVRVGDPIARGTLKAIDYHARVIVYEVAGESRRIKMGQNLAGQTPAPPRLR